MVSKLSLLTLGVVVLVAAGSVGGAGMDSVSVHAQDGDTPTDAPSEETIENHALGNNTTVESVTGTVVIESEFGETNRTMTANVWQRPPDHVRYEFTDGPMAGNVLVSNGSAFWSYNESENTVRRLQLSKLKSGSFQDLQKAFQNLTDQYNAEYKGEATVSGRETYVVSIQPGDSPLGNVTSNQTVWLDQENWFPVKQKTTTSLGNNTTTSTITYSNLSYNETISDEKFTFEPPKDAEIIDTKLPDSTSFSSIENADSAVNFSINEPKSMAGYSVENVSVTTANNRTSVSVVYGNESNTLVFTQSNTETPARGEDVSIGPESVNASYRSVGDQHFLQWNNDGFSYSVSGDLSKSSLIDVAESIYC